VSELQRPIFSFHGGLHLPDHKAESTDRPVEGMPLAQQFILPLQQHIGAAAEPLVQVGEQVLTGQVIARADEYVSAPIHAPCSGSVSAIEERGIPHPSGLSAPCIVIDSDGQDQWSELPEPWPDYAERDPAELRERIRWAGIVGLGGAGFPTSVKANPGPDLPIHTLILNGAECEPYISCDDLLMREQPERVLAGLAVLRHVVGAKECLLGIEDNKPAAIAALRQALAQQPTLTGSSDPVRVMVVPTKYPSGGEKQLIKLLTGREVPSHGLPAEIGVVCQNVATAAAVADAVLEGRPLIERIVTVTGQGAAAPGNFRVRLGTPASAVIAQAGGYTAQAQRLILGGPMMGFALQTDALPITKTANCLLVASTAEAPEAPPTQPCIRCGSCAEACPALLLPQQLYWYARSRDLDKVQDYHLFDCIECGCCAHVCPSHIPLVQYYRYAKTAIWAQEREKTKADLARQRHEFRVARLERLEAERKAKLRRKKEALEAKSKDTAVDPKKAAIEAAMQRVAAKKAAAADQPAGTDQPDQTPET
jgi:electron transport complex protein RnfC